VNSIQQSVKIEVTLRRLKSLRDWLYESAGEDTPFTNELDGIIDYLESKKICTHCDAEFDPPNLILQGWGYFYVLCEKCGFENRVWVIDDA
jgi:hypothetical protein